MCNSLPENVQVTVRNVAQRATLLGKVVQYVAFDTTPN